MTIDAFGRLAQAFADILPLLLLRVILLKISILL